MPLLFDADQAIVLLKLVAAHLLTDFFLQPNYWVQNKERRKERSPYLYAHVLITGTMAGLFTGSVGAGLFVAVTHLGIDLWKLYQTQRSFKNFLLDQLLHISILIVTWLFLIEGFGYLRMVVVSFFGNFRFWAILTTYLLCTYPLGFAVGMSTSRWREQVAAKGESLNEAGKWIGMLERVLILTFLLNNQFEAIGLLIAAKALLRFRDDDLKLTEYVLIGTLLSFTMTIMVGVVLQMVL
ncbi:DUF3307 domain-containing protein [Persicitalea sp.]|uniref:DUF3307 domain-containing protein n=1 Tax=Persicitalea sp. TaxID=3100273 RepID=UPI0035948773